MENKLVPVEVKKRPSLGRFIKNGITLAVLSVSDKGLKKLSDEDTKFLASIINTAVANYNERNGNRLNEKDIARIQKRLSKLDIFTFEEEYSSSRKNIEKQEKKLGRKINAPKTRGYLFTPTSVLMLNKQEWLDYKENHDTKSFVKVIVHEGFHYLTNSLGSKLGTDRVIAEGADESFIVKAFSDGRFSTIKNIGKDKGMVHYNFYSKSRYSPAVSILNMLGIMVNVNPEVTELKGTRNFVKAVKERYGEDFYKSLVKRTNLLLSQDQYAKMRNELFYIKLIQNFVLRTISNEIVENVKTPDEAVRRLKAMQRTEEWSGRILFQRNGKDPKDPKEKPTYETDNSFEFYYRRTYVRVIEKLKERGFIDLKQVEDCKYKQFVFNPLRRIDIENKPGGRTKFVKDIESARTFYKYYYKETDMERIFETQQINLYKRFKKDQTQVRNQINYQPPGPTKQNIQARTLVQTKIPKDIETKPVQAEEKNITSSKNEKDNDIVFGDF